MNTTTFNSRIDNWIRRVEQFAGKIIDDPVLLGRLMMVCIVYTFIMIPCMVVLVQWVQEVFKYGEKISIPNYLFEILVIGVVFAFGMALLYGAVYGKRELYFSISIISITLVGLGGGILAEISNRCILDLQCSVPKYFAGLAIVTGLTLMSLLLSRMFDLSTVFHGFVFLLIAFTQSDLWLFISLTHEGIEPTKGAVRAFMLLFYTFFLLLLLRPKTEEPKKKGYPYR